MAGSFQLFDVSITAARLPSVTAGALWALVVFIWTYRYAGRTAGWIAGVLFALAPGGIYLSQISRFYALHGLLFWVALFGIFMLYHERLSLRRALVVLGLSGLFFYGAYQLQITTLIGLAGVGLWAAIVPLPRLARRLSDQSWFRWAAAALVFLLLVAGFLAWQTGLLESLWRSYRTSSLWASGDRDNFRFYHYWFLSEYPAFYSFLPFAAVVAIAHRPGPGLFAAVVFVTGFIAHSFGAFKGFRLIYYFLPFFFVLWGIATASLLRAVWEHAGTMIHRVFPRLDSLRFKTWAATLCIGAGFVFLLGTTEAYNTTLKLVTLTDAEWPATKPPYRGQADWDRADEILQPLADGADVVLTSAAPKSIYYLGRVDGSISRNLLHGVNPGSGELEPEFTREVQTGHPVISEPGSVRRVMSCYPSGLIVIQQSHWRRPVSVPDRTADFIEDRATRVRLPPEYELEVFVWRSAEETESAECSPPPLALRGQTPP